jgi:hypothetical protein
MAESEAGESGGEPETGVLKQSGGVSFKLLQNPGFLNQSDGVRFKLLQNPGS